MSPGGSGVGRVAAVVLVVAGLAAGVALRADVGRRLEVASVPPVDLATARPAAELWPQAVVSIPDNLPDGRPAWPAGRVDEDRYLMVPSDPSLPYHLPVVLDTRTGDVRELFSDPPGSRERTWVWASVGERSIVAVTAVAGDGQQSTKEVWTAPRAGGPAQRRAVFDTQDVTAYEVGGTVYASLRRFPPPETGPAATIVRILDGGRTQKVVDGFRMRSWSPWAGPETTRGLQTGEELRRSTAPAAAPTFVNVATGERRTPRTPAGVTLIACGVETCVGESREGVVSYRFDGSRQRRVTGLGPGDPYVEVVFDRSGRFAAVRVSDVQHPGGDARSFVWDLTRNTVGALGTNSQLMMQGLVPLGVTGDRESLLDVARIR
ncbi:hypothetical protein GCM10009557_10240 [Virgisporangium ochraceum]|uniref:Uncharacterized protein n=1 Tax=Virgisporangium ochraceum TaxID=65505 RepID=A0A8J4EFV9_9ACTN|nr:hypothetical protein Voc01_081710 [Virgisporangium ochraceum]